MIENNRAKQALGVIQEILEHSTYPDLIEIIRGIVPYLTDFLTYAVANAVGGEVEQQFYVGSRHLANTYGRGTYVTWNRNINIFAVLELVRKLKDKAVFPELLERARQEQKAKRYAKRISFYTIPAYSRDRLDEANRKAKKMLKAGYSADKFNEEFVYQMFGLEHTLKVYPNGKYSRMIQEGTLIEPSNPTSVF